MSECKAVVKVQMNEHITSAILRRVSVRRLSSFVWEVEKELFVEGLQNRMRHFNWFFNLKYECNF